MHAMTGGHVVCRRIRRAVIQEYQLRLSAALVVGAPAGSGSIYLLLPSLVMLSLE